LFGFAPYRNFAPAYQDPEPGTPSRHPGLTDCHSRHTVRKRSQYIFSTNAGNFPWVRLSGIAGLQNVRNVINFVISRNIQITTVQLLKIMKNFSPS
jgi:hypothetical protein